MVKNNKRKKIIYVSGKYSGTPKEINENISLAKKYAVKIWELGYTALCPHLNTFNFQLSSTSIKYQDYIDGDLVLLKNCDAIFMLPEWEKSNGATIEKEFAEDNGMPIFYNLEDINFLF